ncbi:MAG TPA: LysR family transcriptional regulator [Firmicutes bacterium]|nr:LysR family transcriptional regulator [Bacillota bacterium]
MEWQQLEYFRVVARTQHFTKASQSLAISQPALSRSITKLEEEVGVLLFDRVGRTVRLNSFGEIFLKHVESALNEIDQGIQALAQMNNPATGVISLAFLVSLGLNILPEVIGQFNRQYPGVEFRLYESVTPFILKDLINGKVDLCLTSPFENQSGIAWHKLLDDALYAYVPVTHPLASRSSICLAELRDEPFIGFRKNYDMRSLVGEFCRQAGFLPQVKFEGGDIATIVGLVSSGLGVAVIPKFSGAEFSKVKCLPIEEPVCQREIGLAWLRERMLPPSATLFRDFVVHTFEKRGN